MKKALAVFALCALIWNCDSSSEPERPRPGALTASLTVANTDDRSLLLEITGPVSAVSSSDPGLVVFSRTSGNTTRVALIGTLATGVSLQVNVPDVNVAGSYSVRILEVGNEANVLRTGLGGYSARFEVAR